jgi:hypothetical protein
MMDFDEQIALRMAQARIEEAVRSAEQTRAIRAGQPQRSLRARLGSALIRLGQWMMD